MTEFSKVLKTLIIASATLLGMIIMGVFLFLMTIILI